jgi:hypothetical protein
MAQNIQRVTEDALRDLHARELMRLGWYRQLGGRHSEWVHRLRERKAQHQAFLMDLLRRRELGPVWYARLFYYAGHLFGLATAPLPDAWVRWIERTLEWWILIRYERYLKQLTLVGNLRSMVEAMQMKKLPHGEPGPDVIKLLEVYSGEQRALVDGAKLV